MTSDETRELLNMLAEQYPNRKFKNKKQFFETWVAALEQYDCEAVKAVALRYITGNKFFPDLADLTVGLKRKGNDRDDSGLLRKQLDTLSDDSERLHKKYAALSAQGQEGT